MVPTGLTLSSAALLHVCRPATSWLSLPQVKQYPIKHRKRFILWVKSAVDFKILELAQSS